MNLVNFIIHLLSRLHFAWIPFIDNLGITNIMWQNGIHIFIIINILYTNFYNLLLFKSTWLIKLYVVQTCVLSGKTVGTHFSCRNNLFFSQIWAQKLARKWPNLSKKNDFAKIALVYLYLCQIFSQFGGPKFLGSILAKNAHFGHFEPKNGPENGQICQQKIFD